MKHFFLTLFLLTILIGMLLMPRAASPKAPEASTTATSTEVNCIDLGNRKFYCGDPETYPGYMKSLKEKLHSFETKTFKASTTKYSRKDSCHNKRGNKCLTAIGRDTKAGTTVACPRSIKLGTKIQIEGVTYTCEDRTAKWVEAKFGPTFDIFTEDYNEAVTFGRKSLTITML